MAGHALPTGPRACVVAAAWAIVLAHSLLPVVVAQELLGRTVDADLRAGLSVALILVCLAATVAWRPARALRPVLWLFLALVTAQKKSPTRKRYQGSDLGRPRTPVPCPAVIAEPGCLMTSLWGCPG